MLEINGNDISALSDSDLRSLVAFLAMAEIGSNGLPRSCVTAGGHQDASDGGLDVRVECHSELLQPDFVQRRFTGFQVKKPAMHPSAIEKEMRPKGEIREIIQQLANASGSYVIVSSHASLDDKRLTERRRAMRKALESVENADLLHIDFYDRDRLSMWVNSIPGASIWVRNKIGRSLKGWSGVDTWSTPRGTLPIPYLIDNAARLIVDRSTEKTSLPLLDGITTLRTILRKPGKCIRLVGLSGHGKTRLVKALFEEGVGEEALNPILSIYTDYSSPPTPSARDMARELIECRKPAILIVDNCNPATHVELARLCSAEGSPLSLLTIEYDVQDEEQEHTDVFRLQAASTEVITDLIRRQFPEILQVDRDKIAAFSDGNFRIAKVIAQTFKNGESLGSIRSSDLFGRIFHQRRDKNPDLERAAEDLSLLYSIDGEDASNDGELARLATISDIRPKKLYEALVEMQKRGIVQSRGRFRAILPQAIAHRLAVSALGRIPPAAFDEFCSSLSPRMLRSLSRRLGYLHDSESAASIVARWLRRDGPLGDLMAREAEGIAIIANIAPVAPEKVLSRLEEFSRTFVQRLPGDFMPLRRHEWVQLIQSLGYDSSLFDRSASLLAELLGTDQEAFQNDAVPMALAEFFDLFYSGTQATPEQRRDLIRRFARSDVHAIKSCAGIALRGMLKCHHFIRFRESGFGARPRGLEWTPNSQEDISEWFRKAISLTVELAPEIDARGLIAGVIRKAWRYSGCLNEIRIAATIFLKTSPWIDGWFAARAALKYDGQQMPNDTRDQLEHLIEMLKPINTLEVARAVVLGPVSEDSGWDFADGDHDSLTSKQAYERVDEMAYECGRKLSSSASFRSLLVSEIATAPQAPRAFMFGRGLASKASDIVSLWKELCTALCANPGSQIVVVLGGFLHETHCRDKALSDSILEAALSDPVLLHHLPYLQCRVGLDADGIERLRRVIRKGMISSHAFSAITCKGTPPECFVELLQGIATLQGGVEIAIDRLSIYFFLHENNEGITHNPILIELGNELLTRADFSVKSSLRDFGTHEVVSLCLVGEIGRQAAANICQNILQSSSLLTSNPFPHTTKALFQVQPFIALDTFLLQSSAAPLVFVESRLPLGDYVDAETLQKWACVDPGVRYPLIASEISMFEVENGSQSQRISPLFQQLLVASPDKRRFLGSFRKRLHPGGWCGSLADTMVPRRKLLERLAENGDEEVRSWASAALPQIDVWIQQSINDDREREEHFE